MVKKKSNELQKKIVKEEKEISTFIKTHHINYLFLIIGIIILGYILYLNFLPFGYYEELTLDIGSPSDTTGRFYIEENSSLGPRQELNGEYFRILDGVTSIVYEPYGVLKDANVTATIEGEDVYFITAPELPLERDYDFLSSDFNEFVVEAPYSVYEQAINGTITNKLDNLKKFGLKIDFIIKEETKIMDSDIIITQNLKEIVLDYNGTKLTKKLDDYSLGTTKELMLVYNEQELYYFVNKEFIGKMQAQIKNLNIIDANLITIYALEKAQEEIVKDSNGCYEFDGKTRLVWPETYDEFEEGPFTIYAEWIPTKMEDRQQIVGHFNWEIWQNEKSVEFFIGRVYDGGPSYSISYPITEDFFNNKHSLIAIYSPSEDENKEGYIELFVDEKYAGRTTFGQETIWTEYNRANNLTLGWTPHNYGQSPYFEGNICNVSFLENAVDPVKLNYFNDFITRPNEIETIKIPVFGEGQFNSAKIVVSD